MSTLGSAIAYEDFLKLFEECGGADSSYLETHYKRFVFTLDEFLRTWDWRGKRLLDVGGGLMHQAILFRLAGFDVTSADLSSIIWPRARAVAERHGVIILPFESLAAPVELEALSPQSFDVILFAEIIEHITFNPVRMWKALYRVLAPGGRIVISTPSVYSLQGRLWDVPRWRARMGTGLRVDEILLLHDTSPHWKEYSMKELQRYFRLLSRDFHISKTLYVDGQYPEPWSGWRLSAARFLKRRLPPLRQNIHLEVDLTVRREGISIAPGWHWPAPDNSIP
jgi:2-polyprenyl-3-methyl-5-hydroxy-6-metoxy-1,4-benzoquinol methylase